MCFLRTAILAVDDLLNITFILSDQVIKIQGQVLRITGREVGVKFTSEKTDILKLFTALDKEYPKLKIGPRQILSQFNESNDNHLDIDRMLRLDDLDR